MDSINSVETNVSNSQSNYQGIVIIVVVIIGILLFIFLLVEYVTAPAPVIAPFTDGARIRIKSLGNNMYLKTASCVDLGCIGINEICNVGNRVNYSPVIANGVSGEPGTEWVLCQYKGDADENKGDLEAAYLIYNTSSCTLTAVGLTERFVVVDNTTPFICPTFSIRNIKGTCNCDFGGCISTDNRYFNFSLIDSANGNTSSFNQNGIYHISSIDSTPYGNSFNCDRPIKYWYVNNESNLQINCAVNSNLVEHFDQDDKTRDRNSIEHKLNYSFLVEVINKAATSC